MWIWVFLSTVILVNLLVAMFSERYIDVSKRSHSENIVLRCRRVFIHDRIMLVTPPLLNLPYAIGFLGRFYWRRVQRKCASLDQKDRRERGTVRARRVEREKLESLLNGIAKTQPRQVFRSSPTRTPSRFLL